MATPITAGFDADDYLNGGALAFTVRLYESAVLQTTINVSVNYALALDPFRAHVDMSPWRGDTRYTSVRDDVWNQVVLDGVTVTFDATTGLYTFGAPGTQEIELDFTLMPVKACDLIGFYDAFGTTTARASTITSDAPVPFWFDCTFGLGEYREDHEPSTQHDMYVTDGGNVYGVGDMGSPVHSDFSVMAETHAKTFGWKADLEDGASRDTFVIQDFFEHCTWVHPFVVYHETGVALHRLRPEDAYFDHTRVFQNSNKAWNVPLRTYVARL